MRYSLIFLTMERRAAPSGRAMKNSIIGWGAQLISRPEASSILPALNGTGGLSGLSSSRLSPVEKRLR